MYVCMFTAFVKPVGFQGRGTNKKARSVQQVKTGKTSRYIQVVMNIGSYDNPNTVCM